MIPRSLLDRTVAAVHESGVGQRIESLLRPTGDGRPRALSADVFLAGIILTADSNRALSLANVHATLTREIAHSAQVGYGIAYLRPGEDVCRPITIRQVRYMLEAIEKKLAHTQGRAPDLSDEDRVERALALQNLVDAIVGLSVPEHLPVPGTMALDATALDSWGKGKRRPSRKSDDDSNPHRYEDDELPDAAAELGETVTEGYSFDPDATWGYRTRTYDNRTNSCFGYDVFALVGVPGVKEDGDLFPKLTHAISVRPCGRDVVDPSLGMLRELRDAGRPVNELLNDRAFSYKRPERWAEPLRELGIAQVFDLHPADMGPRDHKGIRMIAGVPHCPAMPDRLRDITRPTHLSVPPLKKHPTVDEIARRDLAARQLAEFSDSIAERETYAFVRIKVKAPERAKDQGKTRWSCPAQAGKVRCDNCPLSADLPPDLPEVANPPALKTAPQCCTQVSVTIPGAATAKLAQEHYWGSPEWIASYNRRTHVEGFFGNLKNPSTGNVRRGWCHVVGIVKTSILVACAVTATNIALLRSWASRTGDFTDTLSAPIGDYPRFEEIDSPLMAAPAHGPPQAA